MFYESGVFFPIAPARIYDNPRIVEASRARRRQRRVVAARSEEGRSQASSASPATPCGCRPLAT